MAERARVLSIDGGGTRGIIPALVLAELERLAGRRTFELFDLIAGTSTGGILACALCAPDPMPAEQLVVELSGASDDLDDAGEENLRALRGRAEELIATREDELRALAAALSAP
jgi:predicted acylesterase/phospholipase RssA